jgi:hypothetical protein
MSFNTLSSHRDNIKDLICISVWWEDYIKSYLPEYNRHMLYEEDSYLL